MSSRSNPEVAGLLDGIALQGKTYLHDEAGARQKLLATARTLVRTLETPSESIARMAWAEAITYINTPLPTRCSPFYEIILTQVSAASSKLLCSRHD